MIETRTPSHSSAMMMRRWARWLTWKIVTRLAHPRQRVSGVSNGKHGTIALMRHLLHGSLGDVPRLTKPGADTGVAELQQALTLYAQTLRYPMANPGEVDGLVTVQTATAVLNVIPRLAGKAQLPAEVLGLLQVGGVVALLVPESAEAVYKTIRSYAGYITAAILGSLVVEVVVDPSAAGGGIPDGGTPGRKAAMSVQAAWANAAAGGNAIYAPTVVRTPDGSLIPGNPTQTIWYKSWLTGYYRVAVPKGGGLGATSYKGYIEVSPSVSKPASGTEVSRSAFASAVGQWWATTPGMVIIGVGVVGAGVGTFVLARR